MTDYVKSTNFASKDSLASGNPLKIVKGTEIDTEFTNIATAVATKADLNSPTLIGTPVAPTASAGTNTTQIATTAFIKTAIDNLTLGTISTQSASSVAITGGSVTGITDIAIADGGTGSSTALAAFDNLKQSATEIYTGVVEMATTTEASDGTDTSRAVTPAGVEAHMLANMLGWGQTWQSVTRTSGTTYTNSTGRPIVVTAFSSLGADITVDGVVTASGGQGSGDVVCITTIVPNGSSYILSGSYSVVELR